MHELMVDNVLVFFGGGSVERGLEGAEANGVSWPTLKRACDDRHMTRMDSQRIVNGSGSGCSGSDGGHGDR
eukprot:2925904-Pleurochrysis_carterae.AAC.1